MRIAFVLGTRPEIIKLSPIIRSCIKQRVRFFIIHTNQHYSENLDRIFFRDLNLPRPHYNLHAGTGSQLQQIGKMLEGLERVFQKERPDRVVVQGDTNSVLAGALAAKKIGIPVAHVEAGLRSYDDRMPEEANRILTDHISTFLFPPTRTAKNILLQEGIPASQITITGNTGVDALYENRVLAEKRSRILEHNQLKTGEYMVATCHRAENVDNKKDLKGILDGLSKVTDYFYLPIILPLHPRTRKRLKRFAIKIPEGVTSTAPIGYLDFLRLQSHARLILTDSGGLQEEACVLRVPCVTLRTNTERPETLWVGSNVLAGTNPKKILECAKRMLRKTRNWKNPFGNGTASEKILSTILK